MLRFLWSDELPRFPRLTDTMFRDRATTFRDRMGWPVTVDARGWEQDDYDAERPLYVIWQGADGCHHGSMRFLPTLGRTMVNDHFSHLVPHRIASPRVWECTRFCLSDRAGPQVSAALMLGGAELGVGLGLGHAVGVFDARMVRVYRMLGWSPDILGGEGEGAAAIRLGLWRFDADLPRRLAARAGLNAALARLWFVRDMGGTTALAASA